MQKTLSSINLRKFVIVSAISAVVIVAGSAIVVGTKWPEQARYNVPYLLVVALLYFLAQDLIILATALLTRPTETMVGMRKKFLGVIAMSEIAPIIATLLFFLGAGVYSNHGLAEAVVGLSSLFLVLSGILLCALILFSIVIIVIYIRESGTEKSSQPIQSDAYFDATGEVAATAESDIAKYYRGIFCIPIFGCAPFLIYGLKVSTTYDIYGFFNVFFLLILCIVMAASMLPAVGFILSTMSGNKRVFLLVAVHILAAVLAAVASFAIAKDRSVWSVISVIPIAAISVIANIIAIHQTRKHLC